MKIVIDTNVLISAVIRKNPTIHAVLDACRSGKIKLALSKPILQEFGQVLHRHHIQKLHRMTDSELSKYIKDLSTFAEVVPETILVEASKDPKDNMFFACAIQAQADYIVSGDIHHILSIPSFQGVKTISPTDFVEKVLRSKRR